MSESTFDLFATVPKGLESLLATELRSFGAEALVESRAGVGFQGSLEVALRACLWSRLASRILLRLSAFPVSSAAELYSGVHAVPWEEHLSVDGTFAVDCSGTTSGLTHTGFSALKVKDAVVDRFRERCGCRPSVAPESPDLRLNLHLHRGQAVLSLDLSGESLHRRGYRIDRGLAPMKENLAAAILLRSGWPAVATQGGTLVDPMCGSGTLLIEGALIAADIAPGLLRSYFGFLGWKGHDPALWEQLLGEARDRREAGMTRLPQLIGYDRHPGAIRDAWANLERAGLSGAVHFERRDLAELTAPVGAEKGLLVVNPPYGERLGEVDQLRPLYRLLGEKLREHFAGWRAAVFTGNVELGKEMMLRSRDYQLMYNGPIECRLLHFEVLPEWFKAPKNQTVTLESLSDGGLAFVNRLRKNLKNLGRWARRSGVSCYRLYDADLPDYALAIDLYGSRAHVQEYEAPSTVDEKKAEYRLREALSVLPLVLEIPEGQVFFKVRKRQKGKAQYEKFAGEGEVHEVEEGGLRFLVNLTDYLDTGLFLDHRPTRAMLREMAAGKSFLNLFAYTGTATVYAAAGDASSTVSVDLSRTYLDWARRNLELNGFGGSRHQFVRADVLQWLARERRRFDLIFLDPPTFSTSKGMSATFDVQRDHVPLLQATSELLAPGGKLVFSTNHRRFRLASGSLPQLQFVDLTPRTIPPDFARNPRIHQCWLMTRADRDELS